MLNYHKSGYCDYSVQPVPVNSRAAWEFQCLMSGRIAPSLYRGEVQPRLQERTLWAFPRHHPHGWVAEEPAERIVFHHTTVPAELEQQVPDRGYYRVALTDDDCELIRKLAERAQEIMMRPTRLAILQAQVLAGELSLIALREISQPPLTADSMAREKTDQALVWYREHIAADPTFDEVAAAVHISPTHLRRLFHKSRGEGPHEAFNRVRMEMAEDLLRKTDLILDVLASQLGFSSASAFGRAVKAHFGMTPRALRRGQRPLKILE